MKTREIVDLAPVAMLTPEETAELERLDGERLMFAKRLRELHDAIPPLPPDLGDGGASTNIRILLELRLMRGLQFDNDAAIESAAVCMDQLARREAAEAALRAALNEATQPHTDWVRLRRKAGMPSERWGY